MTTQSAQLNPPPSVPEKDGADYSIAIGLACTVLFHLLLAWLSPQFAFEKFAGSHSGISVTSANKGKTFDFELAQPAVKEEEPLLSQFVEANTAAAENRPDKTVNFSDRDQQSAQEVAAKERDVFNRPSVVGQEKIKDYNAIVSGDNSPPQIAPMPSLDNSQDVPEDRLEQKARAAQTPLSGFDKTEGLSEDGIATNVAKSKQPATQAQEFFEGAPDAKSPEGELVAVAPANRSQPKERPRLSSVSLNKNSILTTRLAGTNREGLQASDAFKTDFGTYLTEFWGIVSAQIYALHRDWTTWPAEGTYVMVQFRLTSAGEISEIVAIEETAGKKAVYTVRAAIETPQPYRKWSDDMIAKLGNSQVLTYTFHYN